MGQVSSSPNRVLEARQGCFFLKGEPRFLVDGEMHYFRIDPQLWSRSLDQLAACGISLISSYIPWVWHEYEEGVFDFTGESDPRRNLIGFLEALKERGLLFMARPGPFIYAEYQGFGCPQWVAHRYPETVALKANGRMDRGPFWYNFSLLHPTYQKLVSLWYGKVIDVLAPYWNDPVASFQIDNEAGFLYTASTGRLDFNVDTSYRFHLFLRKKYGSIVRLNGAWRKSYGSFSEVSPPRRPFRQTEALDWQLFLENWVADYLARLAEMVRSRGVPVPITHNEQCPPHCPAYPRLQSEIVDFIGFDLYIKETDQYHVADFPFANSIYPSFLKPYCGPTRPLLSLELGMGWLDYRSRIYGETLLQNWMGSIAHGVKGFCLFPVHDCVEATGHVYSFQSILDIEGKKTSNFSVVEQIIEFLRSEEEGLLASEESYDPVGFALYHPSYRFYEEEYLPFQRVLDPLKYLAFLSSFGLMALLLTAGYNPKIVDPETASAEDLKAYRILFLPNKGYLDEDAYRKFCHFVHQGGVLVSYPKVPDRDVDGGWAHRGELFPSGVQRERWIGRVPLLWNLMWEYLVKYFFIHRRRIKRRHLTSLHISDIFEPLLCSIQVPLPGIYMETGEGKKIRSDYTEQSFGATDSWVLRRGKRVFGYEQPFGKGRSVVWGSFVGGYYLTPRYYQSPKSQRNDLIHYIHDIMHAAGVKRTYESTLECEIVHRRVSDGSGYLFLLNRLGEQAGQIFFRDLELHEVRTVFSYRGSYGKRKDLSCIDLWLAANDVLVLKYMSPSKSY